MPQPPEHEHEIEVFNGVLKLPVGERAAYLDRECAGDAALRQRVEELLKANEVSCACLEGSDAVSGGPGGVLPLSFTPAMKAGDRIGRYKLLQQIGEGGCGVVYMAEQEEPVRRRVALKVIKPGMDTREVIARFEAERQALALMDHPNIAKVLDAGTVGQAFQPDASANPLANPATLAAAKNSPPLRKGGPGGVAAPGDAALAAQHPDADVNRPASQAGKPDLRATGRPYFVMELVRGVTITEYCDKAKLPPRERLKLFVQVCQAIQHAHQKGVIHRDLKPSNVLVTLHDGVPVPKVIDFGVAKAINQRLTEHTVYTRVAQMLGTPLY